MKTNSAFSKLLKKNVAFYSFSGQVASPERAKCDRRDAKLEVGESKRDISVFSMGRWRPRAPLEGAMEGPGVGLEGPRGDPRSPKVVQGRFTVLLSVPKVLWGG